MSPSPNIGGTCPPCPIGIDAPANITAGDTKLLTTDKTTTSAAFLRHMLKLTKTSVHVWQKPAKHLADSQNGSGTTTASVLTSAFARWPPSYLSFCVAVNRGPFSVASRNIRKLDQLYYALQSTSHRPCRPTLHGRTRSPTLKCYRSLGSKVT